MNTIGKARLNAVIIATTKIVETVCKGRRVLSERPLTQVERISKNHELDIFQASKLEEIASCSFDELRLLIATQILETKGVNAQVKVIVNKAF